MAGGRECDSVSEIAPKLHKARKIIELDLMLTQPPLSKLKFVCAWLCFSIASTFKTFRADFVYATLPPVVPQNSITTVIKDPCSASANLLQFLFSHSQSRQRLCFCYDMWHQTFKKGFSAIYRERFTFDAQHQAMFVEPYTLALRRAFSSSIN